MSAKEWLGWSVGALCTALVAGVANASRGAQGRTFSQEAPPRRIVSLNLAAGVLLALVSPDRIAALTYLAADPSLSNMTQEAKSVGPRVTANTEQVVALEPRLIVVGRHTSGMSEKFDTSTVNGYTFILVFSWTRFRVARNNRESVQITSCRATVRNA